MLFYSWEICLKFTSVKLAVEINYFDTFFYLIYSLCICGSRLYKWRANFCEEFCLSLTQNEFNGFSLMKSQPPSPQMELIANDIELQMT